MMNVRIQFSKGYEVKYVSHLDLMRTLMRSGLPVSYTQGFNPHIILTFAQPLSVGVTSDGEYAEFQMEEQCTFDELKDKKYISIVGTLSVNEFRNQKSINFIIKDIV